MKKAGLWPIHVLCKFWIEYPVLFVYVNNKFCNQNLVLDLFCVVLIISQILK